MARSSRQTELGTNSTPNFCWISAPMRGSVHISAAYHFMLAIGGDLPGYEEATRALFADDRAKLEQCIAGWPKDIRTHTLGLAFGPTDRPTRK